ncbi:MAG TPA: GNAT family N-acetyltransferase [Candidatus Tumulicola sp.]|jgi:ribosomal protein S18 acetylase RimI-like enzyme
MHVSYRPAVASDRAFIESLYFETQRWIIERLFGWRGDDVERQKFDAFYNELSTRVISLEGEDAGWISVTSGDRDVVIEQIYLLPRVQNKGVGSHIISNIIGEARAAGRRVALSTAKINPAIRLYERLGFRKYGENEFKIFMEVAR